MTSADLQALVDNEAVESRDIEHKQALAASVFFVIDKGLDVIFAKLHR